MQKQWFLIPLGIGLIVVGGYMMLPPLEELAPLKLSWMEEQNRLMSTNYPAGTGIASLGMVCIIIVIIWKRKSTQKKT